MSLGSFWLLGVDKQPKWFGGWTGERFCQRSLTAWCRKMAKRRVFSAFPNQGVWLWGMQGGRAMRSTFLQIGNTLPSANRSS